MDTEPQRKVTLLNSGPDPYGTGRTSGDTHYDPVREIKRKQYQRTAIYFVSIILFIGGVVLLALGASCISYASDPLKSKDIICSQLGKSGIIGTLASGIVACLLSCCLSIFAWRWGKKGGERIVSNT